MSQANKYGIGPDDDAMETLSALFDGYHFDELQTILTDCMKCNLGNDEQSGTHDAYRISQQVESIASILKFLRVFQADLCSVEVVADGDEMLKSIEAIFNDFDYEVAFDNIMYGLNEWIFQDCTVYNRGPAEALSIVSVYEQVENILIKCANYYQVLKTVYESENTPCQTKA